MARELYIKNLKVYSNQKRWLLILVYLLRKQALLREQAGINFLFFDIKIASGVEKFAIYYIKIYEQAGKNIWNS